MNSPAEFNPQAYLDQALTVIEPLTTDRGISFASVAAQYPDQLVGLFPEHEGVEVQALVHLDQAYPTTTEVERDSIAQVIGHVSRASAIVESNTGDMTRLGLLPDVQRDAVVDVVVASDLREPNIH